MVHEWVKAVKMGARNADTTKKVRLYVQTVEPPPTSETITTDVRFKVQVESPEETLEHFPVPSAVWAPRGV